MRYYKKIRLPIIIAMLICVKISFVIQAESYENTYFAGVFQASVSKLSEGDNVFYEYPVLTGIEGFDQTIVEKINHHFYEEANETAAIQANELASMREEVMEYNPEAAEHMVYEVTCDQIFIDGEIFSVKQNFYAYTGGAHGYGYSFGTSFNLRTGEKMTMGDLLGCEEDVAEEAVVEAYREHIIGQVENITEESIRDSFDIMEYWMQPEGMYVDIAAYGVASYAAGPQQAVVTPEILERTLENFVTGEKISEKITVINGIQAPVSDFILPYSSVSALTEADLAVLDGVTVEEDHYRSQLAINEILARYGYQFHAEQGGAAKEAYDQFEGKDWYEQAKPYCPSTSASEMLYTYITSLELANIDLICEWQKAHNCYY